MSRRFNCLARSHIVMACCLAVSACTGESVEQDASTNSDKSGLPDIPNINDDLTSQDNGHLDSDALDSASASDSATNASGDGSGDISGASSEEDSKTSGDSDSTSAQSDDSSDEMTTSGDSDTHSDSTGSTDTGTTGTTDDSGDTSTTSDSTTESTSSTTTTSGDTDPCDNLLYATVRDMSLSHPDFESFGGSSPTLGLVKSMLDGDRKPVHASNSATNQTTGPDAFYQWYHDVDGVNFTFERELELTEVEPGIYRYENLSFFPLSVNEGWGGESKNKNFAFTTEIHLQFRYEPGQQFDFDGDDDLWLFVEGKLVLDLGGLHPPAQGSVSIDDYADELGLVAGYQYHMDIFHAERHSTGSRFVIETSIGCISPQR